MLYNASGIYPFLDLPPGCQSLIYFLGGISTLNKGKWGDNDHLYWAVRSYVKAIVNPFQHILVRAKSRANNEILTVIIILAKWVYPLAWLVGWGHLLFVRLLTMRFFSVSLDTEKIIEWREQRKRKKIYFFSFFLVYLVFFLKRKIYTPSFSQYTIVHTFTHFFLFFKRK